MRQIKGRKPGFSYEDAEASLELLLRKAFSQFKDYFQLKNLKVILEKNEEEPTTSEAMIKIVVGDRLYHTAADGDGPVNAMDNALRKALDEVYPAIKDMHLTDYKVRVLNGNEGTAARVRVLMTAPMERISGVRLGYQKT